MSEITPDDELSPSDAESLARYLDGVMDAEARAAFSARLENEPALRELHDGMSAAGALLRREIGAAVDAAEFSGFAAAVLARLDEVPASSAASAASSATSGAPASALTPRPTSGSPISLAARVGAWWSRHWTPVLVSSLAAAAVAFFIVRGRDVAPPEAPAASGTAVVDAVHNDGNKTVLISMPAEEGGATIIWLLDDEEEGAADAPPVPNGEDPI